jgi:hypothetical protein
MHLSLFHKHLICMKENSSRLLIKAKVVASPTRNDLGMAPLMTGR